MDANTEKTAGSNLTPIAEYTETAAALAELKHRFGGVVYDVTTTKGMKEAKEARATTRGYRTSLEKKRVEIKAPALERCRLIDTEAKRITAELVALEEPIDVQIKTEETRAETARLEKLEAERLRVEAIQQKIQQIRDVPASLVGKPSVIIAGQLAKLRETALDEAELGADYLTATDALTAAIARVEQLLQAQQEADAEKKRQAERDAEMEAMRKKMAEQQRLIDEAEEAKRVEQERLRREADERRQADERRAAEERFEAERKERERVDAILARIDGIRCMAVNLDGLMSGELTDTRRALLTMHPDTSGADFAEFKDRAVDTWDEAEAALSQAIERREQKEESARQEARRRAEEDARLQAERERQAAEQRKLDAQAEQLRKDKAEAAKKAEAERLKNLGLREAAQAIVDHCIESAIPEGFAQLVDDLRTALANDENRTAKAKPARTKRAARG